MEISQRKYRANPHWFDVDITSLRQRLNFDKFSRHFQVLFWCNFADRKIYVISTYFFQCNFDSRKIHVVSTYLFRCNFDGRKIYVVSMHFFRCNFFGQNIHVVSTMECVSMFLLIFSKFLKANENIRGGLPVLVTLNSWLLQDRFL